MCVHVHVRPEEVGECLLTLRRVTRDLLTSQIVRPPRLCSQLVHELLELVLDEGESTAPLSKLGQEHGDLRLLRGLLSVHCKIKIDAAIANLVQGVLEPSGWLGVPARCTRTRRIDFICSADSGTRTCIIFGGARRILHTRALTVFARVSTPAHSLMRPGCQLRSP